MTKRNVDYVVADFNNVTEKGLKDLLTALKRAGTPVTSVEATNRKIKKDMVFVKKAKLNFEGGQSATLFVGQDGDIYQLVVNGKKTPLPNAKDIKQFAKGLSNIISSNQAAFDKSAAKKASKAAVANTSQSKPLTRSLKQRAEEAKNYLNSQIESKDELTSQLSTIETELSTVTDQEEAKKAELKEEQKQTAALKATLADLQEQK
ncbi:hypothetical protein [Photobacterium damselae]|uniref:defense against restriction DarA-related protein n=1 Tax=Photobacterium damselae TaxID=38293 RepID=UPI001F3225F5|nr:hypothetical protein [Photobacterium damselae]UKA12804.1 hypothetical protein IHC91_21160 [Photobacterium damselae subsp. damselae]